MLYSIKRQKSFNYTEQALCHRICFLQFAINNRSIGHSSARLGAVALQGKITIGRQQLRHVAQPCILLVCLLPMAICPAILLFLVSLHQDPIVHCSEGSMQIGNTCIHKFLNFNYVCFSSRSVAGYIIAESLHV